MTGSLAKVSDRSAVLRILGVIRVALLAIVLAPATASAAQATGRVDGNGIVKVRSAYGHEETVQRLREDVESKGIRFFQLIAQSALAAEAGITVLPSTLLVFGNPPLGTLFLKSNQLAALDWPVRVLVYTDAKGQVWAAYTDFGWIARRHGVRSKSGPFRKASGVIASIMQSIAATAGRAR